MTSTVYNAYVTKISEEIRRMLSPKGMRVAFNSTITLVQWLTHVKDSIHKYNAGKLVFKFSCQDFPTVCIGETSRSFTDICGLTRGTRKTTKREKRRTHLGYRPSCLRYYNAAAKPGQPGRIQRVVHVAPPISVSSKSSVGLGESYEPNASPMNENWQTQPSWLPKKIWLM